jgi:hypothetical protein
MEYKFKIGDRVKIIDGSGIDGYTGGWVEDMYELCGEIGIVKTCGKTSTRKNYYTLSSVNGKIKSWLMFDERGLKKTYEEKKIIITTDGTITRAALYDGHKLIKEAKAICSKEDVFDFEMGAKIAFERLTAKPAEPNPKKELKPLNTKIFVIDGYNDFKSGHIYEIKDGKIIDNDGWKFPLEGIFYNMNDVHEYFNGSYSIKYNSVGDTLGNYTAHKQVKVMEVKEG